MRVMLFVAVCAAVAMLATPDAVRSALATSASTLFEATPFFLGGIALARLVRGRQAMAFLGCGCGTGPSARSLPATAAAWLVFGPAVAIARLVAAIAVARIVAAKSRHRGESCHATSGAPALLDELDAMLPAAFAAGAMTQLAAFVDVRHLTPPAQVLGGTLLGFAMAPCGIGTVAVAGALHGRAPLAAAAFLCIAGIADLRAFARRQSFCARRHDVLAYALLAAALGIVGWRHGGALVHPAIGVPLLVCCAVSLVFASIYRRQQNAAARFAPALMLAGALVTAPPPAYHATETTLTELFPGEHLTFTGSVTRNAGATALVRYAITCCRADAAPVVVRLAHVPPFPAGTWVRVDGTIAIDARGPQLVSQRIERIAPPTDPFIYR
jgi:hypothetical protein